MFQLAIVGFALLTNKTMDLYNKALSVVGRKTEWKPKSAFSDWENSLRSAICSTWKNAKVYGCRFHYAQAIRKKAKSTSSSDINRRRLQGSVNLRQNSRDGKSFCAFRKIFSKTVGYTNLTQEP